MDDLSYLRGRAREEHVAALRAQDERVRTVHLRMAQLYRQQVRALTIVQLRAMLPTGVQAEPRPGLHRKLIAEPVKI